MYISGWKAKVERAYSLRVQSGKITVWIESPIVNFVTFQAITERCHVMQYISSSKLSIYNTIHIL